MSLHNNKEINSIMEITITNIYQFNAKVYKVTLLYGERERQRERERERERTMIQ
jgi:hypothetical protein